MRSGLVVLRWSLVVILIILVIAVIVVIVVPPLIVWRSIIAPTSHGIHICVLVLDEWALVIKVSGIVT